MLRHIVGVKHQNFRTFERSGSKNLCQGLPIAAEICQKTMVSDLVTRMNTPQVIEKYIVKTPYEPIKATSLIRTDNRNRVVNKHVDDEPDSYEKLLELCSSLQSSTVSLWAEAVAPAVILLIDLFSRSKWIFKIKLDEYERAENKARAINSILLTSASMNMAHAFQIERKNRCPQARTNEVVYVSQPEGFVDPEHPSHDCKFLKIPEASLSTNPNMRSEIFEKVGLTPHNPLTLQWRASNLDEDKGCKLIDPYTISCAHTRIVHDTGNYQEANRGSAQ
ncbi:hypothetical protein Tco_0643761 [Tanacetum coccineum]